MSTEEELRIVILGPVGAGKSSTGNSILGDYQFKTGASGDSITNICELMGTKIKSRKIKVVDTPGIYDKHENSNLLKEIERSITLVSPGPNVFLLCFEMSRSNAYNFKLIYDRLVYLFGEKMFQYAIIILTNVDQWQDRFGQEHEREATASDIREFFIKELPDDAKNIFQKCNGRFVTINNSSKDRFQLNQKVSEIIEKSYECLAIKSKEDQHFVPEIPENEQQQHAHNENTSSRLIPGSLIAGAIGGVLIAGAAGVFVVKKYW